jgi:hypothetical protein
VHPGAGAAGALGRASDAFGCGPGQSRKPRRPGLGAGIEADSVGGREGDVLIMQGLKKRAVPWGGPFPHQTLNSHHAVESPRLLKFFLLHFLESWFLNQSHLERKGTFYFWSHSKSLKILPSDFLRKLIRL